MRGMLREVDESEFKSYVAKVEKPLLIYFGAAWCNPCRLQIPILYDLAGVLNGKVSFAKVNVDLSTKLCEELTVKNIPTLLLYVKGEIAERKTGLQTAAELSEMLIKYI